MTKTVERHGLVKMVTVSFIHSWTNVLSEARRLI
jgi:hypothetical protein